MDFCRINKLVDTGLVEAFYTLKSWSNWPANEPDNIEGYEKAAEIFGISVDNIIRIAQTHTNKVKLVQAVDGGEGITKETKPGFDGMVTNESGLMLATVEADCVPVYMLDPAKKVIAMVHSGWKGTAGKIANDAVSLMKNEFGSNAEDILVCFGPCICGDCYEVSDDLIPKFEESYTKKQVESFFTPKPNGKYMLDLVKAITTALLEVGLKKCNIAETEDCTLENTNLCSWRRDADPKARMLTAIMLK